MLYLHCLRIKIFQYTLNSFGQNMCSYLHITGGNRHAGQLAGYQQTQAQEEVGVWTLQNYNGTESLSGIISLSHWISIKILFNWITFF